MSDGDVFLRARDFLLERRDDCAAAGRDFRWPQLRNFNWAFDYFDRMAATNARTALWITGDTGTQTRLSFDDLSRRSNQVANNLRQLGVKRGDRILLMLGNVV